MTSRSPEPQPWHQSPGVAALVGILAILGAVFAFGDRMWVSRDKFDDRMDRLDGRLNGMQAEIRQYHTEGRGNP